MEEVDQIETEPKGDCVKQLPKISNGTSQNGSSPDSGHPSSRNFSVTSGQSDSISTEDSGIHEPNLKASQLLAKPNQSDLTRMETGASESDTQGTEQDVLKATQPKIDENQLDDVTAKTSKDSDMSQRALKSTAAEQTDEKVVNKKTTNNDMHRTAPVVEETVVPLVHEAFSRREMSEVQADESDESPSAIEMEDIPTANVCMAWKSPSKTSEQTPVPLLQLGLEENTSPEEPVSVPPEDNLCPQFDSLAVNTEKNEVTSPVSSVGTTYSVSTS